MTTSNTTTDETISAEAAVAEATAVGGGSDAVLGSEEIKSWVRLAIDGADEKLGQRTEAFFVGDILGITDWFVVTSGKTGRQVKAIAESVEEMLMLGDGPKPIRIEGLNAPDWVLMDFGSFIVHVFTDEAREYYSLERLWSDVERLDGLSAPGEAADQQSDVNAAEPTSDDAEATE